MNDYFTHVETNKKVWWRFLLLSLPMIGLTVLSSHLLSQSEQEKHLDTVRMETAHHIESQAKNVRVEIKQAVLHVKFLAKHSEVKNVLLGDNEHALYELNQDFYSFSRYMGVYDQVRLLNQHGRELVRANFKNNKTQMTATEDLQDKSQHDYFKQAMAMPDQSVFISKLTLNIEHGQIELPLKPVMRFVAPVIGENGEKMGVVVLNYQGKVLIDRYLDATDVRGENMLLNANSFFFHADDETSTWGSVFKDRKDKSLAKRFPDAWNIIVDQRNGQVLTEQGLFTFATISPYALIGQQPADTGAGDWIIVSYVSCDALHPDSDTISLFFITSSLFLLILCLSFIWLWIRSELHREHLLTEKRSLLRLQMAAQEKERHELARALHDDMGQSLTSIQTYAAALAKISLDKKAHDSIQHIRDITRHIQQAVRDQLQGLRPASLDRMGLCAALEDMLEKFSQREHINYDLICEPQPLELDDEQNIHLFRIVQEALTNIAKYSQAHHVSVHLYARDHELSLSICDDGRGMDNNARGSGMGILGMRERAELLHGNIRIESTLTNGVNILVTIPREIKS